MNTNQNQKGEKKLPLTYRKHLQSEERKIYRQSIDGSGEQNE